MFDSCCGLNSFATSALLAASAFQTRLSGANLVALTTLASPYTAVATDRGSKSGSFCSMESSNGASALLRRSSAFIHSHSSRLWRTSLPRVLQQMLTSTGRIWSAWRSWACSTSRAVRSSPMRGTLPPRTAPLPPRAAALPPRAGALPPPAAAADNQRRTVNIETRPSQPSIKSSQV